MRMLRVARFVFLLTMLSTAATAVAALQLPAFLDEHRGKVVLVDFWASWCVPCRRSFPWLNDMQRKYAADGLVIIGINEDDDQNEATGFLAQYPAEFQILPDPGGRIASQFELLAMPSSFLIGRDGELITNHLGFKVAKIAEYEATLRQALGLDAPVAGH